MEQKDKIIRDKKALKLFVIISVGLSFLFEIAYIIFHAITGQTNGLFMVAVMWTPAITAIVLTIKYYKKISMLGVTIGKAGPILLGLFLPFIYLVLSYFISWAILGDKTTGFETLALSLGWQEGRGDIPVIFVLTHVLVGIIPGCAGAFGEEIGWRGFMYPVMERVHGRKKALIYSGVIFAFWHLPLVISGLYETYTVRWYGVVFFMIYAFVFNFILCWLRSISKSILPALLAHASSNLFGQLVFHQLSTDKRVPYLAGESGIITILLIAVTSLIGWGLWKKHDIKRNAMLEEKKISK